MDWTRRPVALFYADVAGPGDLTQLLEKAREGDTDANAAIMPLVYAKLREIASGKLRKYAPGHTLQPTALVHEAYLRALGKEASFENRRHFFYVAARAMRDILVEHARAAGSAKRGGDQVFVSVDDIQISFDSSIEELVALDEALTLLEQDSPRQYQLVMLRYFAGMSSGEAADVMGVGMRTAERDWRFARAYLHEALTRSSP